MPLTSYNWDMRSRNSLKKGLNRTYTCRFKKKKEKIDQETEGLGTAIKSESLKLGNDAATCTWYITSWKSTGNVRAASSSSFKLQWTRVSSWKQEKKKTNYFYFIVVFNLSLFFILFWDESIRDILLLTRSRTRENSGVLRVFKGSAGLRVNCSSVSGGTCLMKKYLEFKETKRKYINSQKSQVFKCPSWTFDSNITYLLFLL